ncbi:MAG: shikimate kinase [Nitriliruptoraceae bacterium]
MIVLVGFMGAGKTSVGARLARRLGMPFVDVDKAIEAAEGRRIATIFSESGEAAFRTIERDTVAAALAGDDAVVALGGGAVEDDQTRQRLAAHTVIHLAVDLATVRRRVGDDRRRPMLQTHDVEALFARRVPVYSSVADHTVVTDGRAPDVIVDEIIAALPAAGEGTAHA